MFNSPLSLPPFLIPNWRALGALTPSVPLCLSLRSQLAYTWPKIVFPADSRSWHPLTTRADMFASAFFM